MQQKSQPIDIPHGSCVKSLELSYLTVLNLTSTLSVEQSTTSTGRCGFVVELPWLDRIQVSEVSLNPTETPAASLVIGDRFQQIWLPKLWP
jgi:hypothetical protein